MLLDRFIYIFLLSFDSFCTCILDDVYSCIMSRTILFESIFLLLINMQSRWSNSKIIILLYYLDSERIMILFLSLTRIWNAHHRFALSSQSIVSMKGDLHNFRWNAVGKTIYNGKCPSHSKYIFIRYTCTMMLMTCPLFVLMGIFLFCLNEQILTRLRTKSVTRHCMKIAEKNQILFTQRNFV